MKKIISLIVGIALLVGIIIGATAIYNDYMEENRPSNIVIVGGKGDKTESGSESETESETEGETESETVTKSEDSEDSQSSAGDVEENTESDALGGSTEEKESEHTTETEYVSPYLAKDFTVYDIDGNPVKLSDFRGRPIVLNFWASDCYYCVQEMPDFQDAYEKYGDEVVFLMVCHVRFGNRTPAYEMNFIDGNGYTFPVYFDTKQEAVSAYYISGIPQTFFIDRNFDLYTYIPGMATAEALETCIGWILE